MEELEHHKHHKHHEHHEHHGYGEAVHPEGIPEKVEEMRYLMEKYLFTLQQGVPNERLAKQIHEHFDNIHGRAAEKEKKSFFDKVKELFGKEPKTAIGKNKNLNVRINVKREHGR
jgi:hypothetical protein